jgi:hypothetical protein
MLFGVYLLIRKRAVLRYIFRLLAVYVPSKDGRIPSNRCRIFDFDIYLLTIACYNATKHRCLLYCKQTGIIP